MTVRRLRPATGESPAIAAPPGGESSLLMHAAWLMSVMLILRPHELVPAIAPVRPVILTTLFSIAVLAFKAPWPQVTGNPVARLYAMYLGWAILTAPFALYRGATVLIVQKMMVSLVFMALIAALPRRLGTIRTLANRFLFAYLVFAAQVLRAGNVGGTGRIMGLTMYDSNELAVLAVTAFGLAIGAIRTPGVWSRLVGAASAALSLIIIVRSGSRGGGIAAVVALALTLLLFRGRWRVAGIFAGVVFTLLAMSNPIFRDRISTVDEVSSDYNMTTYNGRWEIWKRGMSYIAKDPVMGVGVNNFTEAEGRKRQENGVKGMWANAHNVFVQVGAELGLVGLGIFLALIGAGWRGALVAWKHRAHPAAMPELAVAIGGLVVGAVFLSLAYTEYVFFPLALGAAAGLEWRTALRSPVAVPASSGAGPAAGRRVAGARHPRSPRWRGGAAAGILPAPTQLPS
ncbi:MAG: O-antigen ligase family protein [Gemmatimonadetes bacterium]|nr:O-antigen ligase family protein [Gemmatimonadota bacterium]